MTMATTLLAPIVTPALTWLLAGAWIHVSFLSMMISIVQMVLVPVLLGLGVNHFFSRSVEKVLPAMPVVSVVTIVILVGCVVSLSASRLFDVGLLMAVIVVLHNVFGLTLGYLMAKVFRLDSKKIPDRRYRSGHAEFRNGGVIGRFVLQSGSGYSRRYFQCLAQYFRFPHCQLLLSP